jgi:hypothetical protein
MMRKIFVAATVTAALCSLAISVAPALGLEFEGEGTFSETSSSTAPTIFLGSGSAGRVECSKMTMKATLKVGAFTKLHGSLEKYTTCKYIHGLANEPVSVQTLACAITLESADLVELAEEEFGEGRVKFCQLEIENVSGGCFVEIGGTTAALPEYEWLNLNGTLGRYESLIHFTIGGLEYKVTKVGSAACKTAGDSGSDGKYEGSIPIKSVTIFPEF